MRSVGSSRPPMRSPASASVSPWPRWPAPTRAGRKPPFASCSASCTTNTSKKSVSLSSVLAARSPKAKETPGAAGSFSTATSRSPAGPARSNATSLPNASSVCPATPDPARRSRAGPDTAAAGDVSTAGRGQGDLLAGVDEVDVARVQAGPVRVADPLPVGRDLGVRQRRDWPTADLGQLSRGDAPQVVTVDG